MDDGVNELRKVGMQTYQVKRLAKNHMVVSNLFQVTMPYHFGEQKQLVDIAQYKICINRTIHLQSAKVEPYHYIFLV